MGPVMFDLEGTSLSAAEKERIGHPAAGGVILFARNYESPEQIAALIGAVRAQRGGAFLIAVDHEGGRVQRFRAGFSRLPPAARYGEIYRHDPHGALEAAEQGGWLMALELRAVGVDFSFAPVLDVDSGVSAIIADRAFSRSPDAVADLAAAFRAGMKRAGMAAVGKHFPGHGGVAPDSHLTLPRDPRGWDLLWGCDLLPFRRLIDAGMEAVMPAHVVYDELDDRPAGFSRFWLQQVLRERLGFDGAVFSDDLCMEGASVAGDYVERARAALHAGCDMVLVCNRVEASERILDGLVFAEDVRRGRRLRRMRGSGAVDRGALARSPLANRARELMRRLAPEGPCAES